MTEVINRSYYDAAQKGVQDRQNFQTNALNQRMGQQRLEHNALAQSRETEDRASMLQKEFATKMVQAAQYGIASNEPKRFIEQNYPQLAQAYGPDWANATDDQVRSGLQDAIGKFGPQAGIGPVAQKPDEFTLSPGQKRFVNGREVAAVPPNPSRGIKVRSADGSEITIGGDGVPDYAPTELSKPSRNKLEETFINSQGNAFALREQLAKYRDEFSTFAGQAKAAIASGKEKLGMENAPQQQQFLADFTSWKSDTARLLSSYLNQLSGAAISPHEETRLKAGFPNDGDSPTVYKAKAESTMRSFALAQARAAYLLSKPDLSLDSVSLEGMSNVIATEANKLARALEKGGMDADAARQKAIADTRQRFGLQ